MSMPLASTKKPATPRSALYQQMQTLVALLFVVVGCGGTRCVCRSTAEGAGAWVNNGNFSNLQGAVELEENVSQSFGFTQRLRWWFLCWWPHHWWPLRWWPLR
jgi:hypothetical protein